MRVVQPGLSQLVDKQPESEAKERSLIPQPDIGGVTDIP